MWRNTNTISGLAKQLVWDIYVICLRLSLSLKRARLFTTDVKQPSVKSAAKRADSEHVKMFTRISQSTLCHETNLSSVVGIYALPYIIWAYFHQFLCRRCSEKEGFTLWGLKASVQMFHTSDKNWSRRFILVVWTNISLYYCHWQKKKLQ